MISQRLPVIVIGGGIGGLTLAHACHRTGIPVGVYERASKLVTEQGGKGIGLWGPALTALRGTLTSHTHPHPHTHTLISF
jgi:2-polyprenyl-6-methoxyphenol hydroxylase-like FAD-dependent oxidoreductase